MKIEVYFKENSDPKYVTFAKSTVSAQVLPSWLVAHWKLLLVAISLLLLLLLLLISWAAGRMAFFTIAFALLLYTSGTAGTSGLLIALALLGCTSLVSGLSNYFDINQFVDKIRSKLPW